MVNDLIIIGAGPAGLAAGIYASERNLSTVLLETKEPGGQLVRLYPDKPIYDFPGYLKILGKELAQIMTQQATQKGVHILNGLTAFDYTITENKTFQITTGESEIFESKAIILATGIGYYKPKKLESITDFEKNVFYSFPDISILHDKRVVVIGGGETAIESASLAQSAGAKSVDLIHRHTEFRGNEKKIETFLMQHGIIYTPYEIKEIQHDDNGKNILIEHIETHQIRTIEADILCIHIGYEQDSSLIERWKLASENHAVIINKTMETNIQGIFACGDVTIPMGDFKRITIAMGQAAVTVQTVYKYLKNPYWK